MLINTDLCWFQELAAYISAYIDDKCPQIISSIRGGEDDLDSYYLLNDHLTGLPFGATQDQVLGVLRLIVDVELFSDDMFDNFDFKAWQQGELAQMKLHRLIREKSIPPDFNVQDNRAQFTTQLTLTPQSSTLQKVGLLISLLSPEDGDTDDSQACRFAAAADAFLNHGMYAFTPVHRDTLLKAIATHQSSIALCSALIAGISGMFLHGSDAAAAVAKLQSLQLFITTATKLEVRCQKVSFDKAVIARAKDLLQAAAATTFEDVVALLKACEGGEAALNDFVADYHCVRGLINQGVSFDQFESEGLEVVAGQALLGNLDALFSAGAIAHHDNTISGFVARVLSQDTVDINAIRGRLVELSIDMALREPDDFARSHTINHFTGLYSGQTHYSREDNVIFRRERLDSIVEKLAVYLDSVDLASDDLVNVRSILGHYKAIFETFNTQGVLRVYQPLRHNLAVYHGSRALQDFVNQHPLVANKLAKIYGNFNRVCQNFLMCRLPKPVQKISLICDIQQRIDAITTVDGFHSLRRDISHLTATWYASNTRLRRDLARAARDYILSSRDGALFALLGKSITPNEIIASCNSLTCSYERDSVTPQDLQRKVLEYLRGLLADAEARSATPETIATLAAHLKRIVEESSKYPTELNKSDIATELSGHFLEFVSAGLITSDNVATVRAFLGEGVVQSDNLEAEITRRRDLFFNETLAAERVSREIMSKSLRLLSAANEKLVSREFLTAVCGRLEYDVEIGQLDKLLAHGLLLSDIIDMKLPGISPADRRHLGDKVQAYVVSEVKKITNSDLTQVTNDSRKNVRTAFTRLIRILRNADRPETQSAIRAEIEHSAIDLLQRGVSVAQLTAVDPRLTLAVLESKITDQVDMSVEDKVALLSRIRLDTSASMASEHFRDSLPPHYGAQVSKALSNRHIPEFQRPLIVAKAFADIQSKYHENIDDTGRLMEGVSDTDMQAIWVDYKKAFNAAVKNAREIAVRIQHSEDLSPAGLENAANTKAVIKGLHAKTEELNCGSVGSIESIHLRLQEIDALQKSAVVTPTEDAAQALRCAKTALAGYEDARLNELTTEYIKDRKHLSDLAGQVEDKLIAIDMLMSVDTVNVFREALLQDVQAWEIRSSSTVSVEHIKNALLPYLKTPILLYKAQAEMFRQIIESLPGLTPRNKAVFTRNLTLSIKKAETVTVAAIKKSLSAQGVMGFFASSEALADQATELWHQRLNFARIKLELEEQLAKPVEIVAQLKERLKALKAKVNAAETAERPGNLAKKIVIFETSLPLALNEKLSFANVETLFSGQGQVGTQGSVPPRDAITAEELAGHRYVIKLDERHFTTVNVLKIDDHRPLRIEMAMQNIQEVNLAARTLTRVNLKRLPIGEFIDLAIKMGAVLAQARMDTSEHEKISMFWNQPRKSLDISGDFSQADTREGLFELAAMYVAVRMLEGQNYRVDRDSPVYKRFDAALQKHAEVTMTDEFKEAISKIAVLNQTNLADTMQEATGGLARAFAPGAR